MLGGRARRRQPDPEPPRVVRHHVDRLPQGGRRVEGRKQSLVGGRVERQAVGDARFADMPRNATYGGATLVGAGLALLAMVVGPL